MSLVLAALFVLTGIVHDRTTAQPLPNVVLHAGALHAKTDATGRYTLRGLRPGALEIELESDDVPPQRFELTLVKPTTHHDFTACSTTLDYSCTPGGAP